MYNQMIRFQIRQSINQSDFLTIDFQNSITHSSMSEYFNRMCFLGRILCPVFVICSPLKAKKTPKNLKTFSKTLCLSGADTKAVTSSNYRLGLSLHLTP